MKTYLFFLLLMSSVPANTQGAGNAGVQVRFSASTPCDSAVRSVLEISQNTPCDSIRWQLQLGAVEGSFQLSLRYGESKPNTNGFINGGAEYLATGVFEVVEQVEPEVKRRWYVLKSSGFAAPLLLAEIHPSLLHIADNNRRLMVGNGGWSYVLNRVN